MTEKVLILNQDADWFAERLQAACPAYSYQTARTGEEARREAGDTDILIGLAPHIDGGLLRAMPQLKWVHALTTGVDNLTRSPDLRDHVVLSNSSGFHGPQMSELTVLLMLSTLRDYPRILENQRHKDWQRWPQPLLKGRTACVLGLGAIAEDLAVRLLAFGMTLTGVSEGRDTVDGFSRIYRRSELAAAAHEADFLIVLVPYSEATHHIVNDAVLSAMRPDTILINVARGGCVDEDALQRHLRAGSIKTAALDVFETEPLPSQSPFWDLPGVTITPHLGGFSDTYREQVLPIVIDHLEAWQNGGATALQGRIHRETDQ